MSRQTQQPNTQLRLTRRGHRLLTLQKALQEAGRTLQSFTIRDLSDMSSEELDNYENMVVYIDDHK